MKSDFGLRVSALGLLSLLLGFAGCRRHEPASTHTNADAHRPLVIGVSLMNLSSEFIVMVDQALEAKAKELGVKLLVNDAQRSPEKQVQQVESFIAQRVNAIILNPCEVEASSPSPRLWPPTFPLSTSTPRPKPSPQRPLARETRSPRGWRWATSRGASMARAAW